MPYINCPECGVRSFVLAPWSAKGRCPTCEAPLTVPRRSVVEDQGQNWAQGALLDRRRRRDEETGETR